MDGHVFFFAGSVDGVYLPFRTPSRTSMSRERVNVRVVLRIVEGQVHGDDTSQWEWE